jgi:hypothetical protein
MLRQFSTALSALEDSDKLGHFELGVLAVPKARHLFPSSSCLVTIRPVWGLHPRSATLKPLEKDVKVIKKSPKNKNQDFLVPICVLKQLEQTRKLST